MAEGHVAFLRTFCDYAILAGMMTETTELQKRKEPATPGASCTCGAWTGDVSIQASTQQGTNANSLLILWCGSRSFLHGLQMACK